MAAPFQDTFTEASNTALESHTPDVGTSWTRLNGAASAALVIAVTDDVEGRSATSTYYYSDDLGSADNYILGIPAGLSATGNTAFATRFVDDSNYIGMRIAGSGSAGFRAHKNVAGTITDLYSMQGVAGNSYKLEVSGSTAILYENGVNKSGSLTYTENTTNTRQGMVVKSSSVNAWMTYYEADILGGGGTTVALTGQAITSAKGSFGVTADKVLTGQSSTSSSGTLGVTVDKALTGQSITLSPGTLAAAISIALSGQSITSSYGTLGVTGDVLVALSGLGITASLGSLGISVTKVLSGLELTSSLGTVSPSTDVLVALTGLATTVAHGTLGVSIAKALSGLGMTISQGTLHVTGSNIGADTIVTRFEGVSKVAGGQGHGGVGGSTVSRIVYVVTEYGDGTADVVEEIVVGSGEVTSREYEYTIN